MPPYMTDLSSGSGYHLDEAIPYFGISVGLEESDSNETSRDFEGELKTASSIKEAGSIFFDFVRNELKLLGIEHIAEIQGKKGDSTIHYSLEAIKPRHKFRKMTICVCSNMLRVGRVCASFEDLKKNGLEGVWTSFVLHI